MLVADLTRDLPLKLAGGAQGLQREVQGGFVSDLMGCALAQAGEGTVWVTMQGDVNLLAGASLAGMAAVIVAGGAKPEQAALEKADEVGMPLLVTDLPAFDIVCRLHALGVNQAICDPILRI